MKQIKINPQNKPYYSKDFIEGFECGTRTQFEADKEMIDRIKKARLELGDYNARTEFDLDLAVEILDRMIAEVDG